MINPIKDIENRITSILIDEYGDKDYYIELIRQRKSVDFGTTDYVDFALPCFRIAKIVGRSVDELVDFIKNELQVTEELNARYDVVSGYLNIELSNAAIQMLTNNMPEFDEKDGVSGICFIALSGGEEKELNVVASLLSDLFAKTGISIKVSKAWGNELSDDKIKESISDSHGVDLHSYISNEALFLNMDGTHYSLKDVRGLYKDYARLLLSLSILPKTHQVYLGARTDYVDFSSKFFASKKSGAIVRGFQPSVVKADIREIGAKISDASSVGSHIAGVLRDTSSAGLNRQSRVELLDLVFFMHDIEKALYIGNIPMVFDRLNQVLDSISYLRNACLSRD